MLTTQPAVARAAVTMARDGSTFGSAVVGARAVRWRFAADALGADTVAGTTRLLVVDLPG